MSKEIDDFMRLAEKKLPDYSIEKAKEVANKFAGEYGQAYVVLKNGGLQVWSKTVADKCGREYIWSTEGEENV